MILGLATCTYCLSARNSVDRHMREVHARDWVLGARHARRVGGWSVLAVLVLSE